MDVDAEFLPVAEELVNEFATAITYIRNLGTSYNPATGEVTQNTEQYAINAGIPSSGRLEQGGVGETRELNLWIDHSTSGLPYLPTTGDVVEYMGVTWKVTAIEPTYSSDGLIASKLLARAS